MTKLVPQTTSEQLALSLFSDLEVQGTPGTSVAQASRDVGFRKNNVFLDVTELSLVARQALNAMYFLAAQNPTRGAYDCELRFFKWLIGYESRNLKHLKAAMQETHKSSLALPVDDDDTKPWGSTALVTWVTVGGGRVGFELPERVRRCLTDPQSFTYLSLRITAGFKSKYGYLLYERLQALRYRTQGGFTDWIALDEVKRWLEVSNVKTYELYKNFTRFVLYRAIEEIGQLSDLRVKVFSKLTPGTRAVGFLRFHLEDNPDGLLVQNARRMAAMTEHYSTLVHEFGLPESFLEEIFSDRDKYDDAVIQAAVEYTRWKMETGEIKKAAPYLMRAIRDRYALSPAQRQIIEQQRARIAASSQSAAAVAVTAERSAQSLNRELAAARPASEQAIEAFLALPEARRVTEVAAFGRTLQYKTAMRGVLKTGAVVPKATEELLLKFAPVRHAFGVYLDEARRR